MSYFCLYFCDKISRPKASEGGKGYFNLQLSVTITEGSYRKNSSQKPGGKKWSRDHGGVLLSGLLLWLSQSAFYTAQNHLPRADIAHNEVGPPTSTIINKMHHRLAHKTIWWRHFFQLGISPVDDSSLCPIDMKLAAHWLCLSLLCSVIKWPESFERMKARVLFKAFLWFPTFFKAKPKVISTHVTQPWPQLLPLTNHLSSLACLHPHLTWGHWPGWPTTRVIFPFTSR